MTRTERANQGRQKPSKKAGSGAARRSQISRSLSKLLRHQAENEKVPITAAGWVKVEDILAWQGLQRIDKGITLSDILDVVEEDGRTGKGRFGVRFTGGDGVADASRNDTDGPAEANSATRDEAIKHITQMPSSSLQPQVPIDSESKNTPETQAALHHHSIHPNSPPSEYLIRATQGHSMKSVQSTDLLTPITPSDPSSIPATVVHGTFYGAWSSILSSGGLKSMGRNNIHFATGPVFDEVVDMAGDNGKAMSKKSQVEEVLSRNKVISGMRWDAQILIYIDLKRCLEDVKAKGLDMTWWVSGNGVVLTEGVAVPGDTTPQPSTVYVNLPVDNNEPIVASASVKADKHQANLDAEAGTAQQQPQQQPQTQPTISLTQDTDEPVIASKAAKAQAAQPSQPTTPSPNHLPSQPPPHANSPKSSLSSSNTATKLVPTTYWLAAVEIKHGLGVIWRQGEGVVKELPARLRSMPLPRGKARGHGELRVGGNGKEQGKWKGKAKPRLNVETDAGGDDGDGGEDER